MSTRTRYVYRDTNPVDPVTGLPSGVPVGEDYQPPGAERAPLFTDRFMEGQRAQDGTDIGSKAKRRQYMQAMGVADASDFTEHWKKAAATREDPQRHAAGVRSALIESLASKGRT